MGLGIWIKWTSDYLDAQSLDDTLLRRRWRRVTSEHLYRPLLGGWGQRSARAFFSHLQPEEAQREQRCSHIPDNPATQDDADEDGSYCSSCEHLSKLLSHKSDPVSSVMAEKKKKPTLITRAKVREGLDSAKTAEMFRLQHKFKS